MRNPKKDKIFYIREGDFEHEVLKTRYKEPPWQPWNFFYDGNLYFFRAIRCTGMFPIQRDAEGVLRFKFFSLLTLYTLLWNAMSQGVNVYLLPKLLHNFSTAPLSYEHKVLYCIFFEEILLNLMPLVFFLDSPRIAKYMQKWDIFQKFLESKTGKPHRRPSSKNCFNPFFVLMTFMGLILFSLIHKYEEIIASYGLDTAFHRFLLMYGPLAGHSVTNVCALFAFALHALSEASEILIAEIESLQWTKKSQIDDYIILWFQLRQLALEFGNFAYFSYMAVLGLLFFTSLPALYIACYFAYLMGAYNYFIIPVVCFFALTSFTEIVNRIECKVVVEFHDRLLNLLISDKAADHQKELITFAQIVASTPTTIQLGGFFQLNRSMNAPMYATVITYFVIIIQFSMTNEENMEILQAGLTFNCSAEGLINCIKNIHR